MLHRSSINTGRRLTLVTVGLCIFALLLWLPALFTPWWGDDYWFLQAAHRARLNHEPWWQAFWPEVRTGFWRPLSIDSYWRFAEDALGANVFLAHLLNYVLWLAACAAVSVLGWVLALRLQWRSPLLIAFMAAGIYGLNGTHLLALHWASAANSSILVCWMALAMAAWAAAPSAYGRRQWLLYFAVVVLQLLALLSKESAILLPALLVVLRLFTSQQLIPSQWRPAQRELIALVSCVLVGGIWLLCFREFTAHRHPGYALNIGNNLLRNALALSAWLLNIPREAGRMIVDGQECSGYLWAIASALPMLGFLYLSLRSLRQSLSRHQWLAALAFIPLAYAPYFLLASQSYEYYAAVALILPAILLAQGVSLNPQAWIAAVLLCLSSFINVQGNRLLDYPSLLGRAHWAEQQLQWLETQNIGKPLIVTITNPHQFYAIGVAGLAWRLGVGESDILLRDDCPAGSERRLVQGDAGNFQWENCPQVSR